MRGKWRAVSLAAALATLTSLMALMVLVLGCSSEQASSGSASGEGASSAGNSAASASAASASSADASETAASTADAYTADGSTADGSASASSSGSSTSSTNASPDYSRESCWYQIPEITKDVDTFFIYPTEYSAENEGDSDYAPLDDPDMVEGVKYDHKVMASVFEEATNVFIPYYRQASIQALKRAHKETGDMRTALTGTPYEDITAALDYYFENYNEGRPFVIASHSQGSAINSLALKDYFKEHPDRYELMVASYMLGFSLTKDWLKDNPHLKCATGEADTGVIVSWNTEGALNVEQNAANVVVMPGAISINPLNWRLDATYAPASANKGSLVVDEESGDVSIGDVGADAQVNTDRGVVVTNANAKPSSGVKLFGPASFHNGEYTLFYNNIKENVAKRIATYQASR